MKFRGCPDTGSSLLRKEEFPPREMMRLAQSATRESRATAEIET
jgi:hypothetical protein